MHDDTVRSQVEPGTLLHAVTVTRIVRLPFLIAGVLVLLAISAVIVSSVHTVRDAFMALGCLAILVSWPAFIFGLRWAGPQLAAVHEHGVVIRCRGRSQFVPWTQVGRIIAQTLSIQGVPTIQYVIPCGAQQVSVGEALVGRDLMNTLVGVISTRTGQR